MTKVCWVCGKRETVTEVFGYSVCEVCKEKDIGVKRRISTPRRWMTW